MQIPKKVSYILNRLKEHGYEAYAVGGCVRDALLKREPKDWDITTSAFPEQVKAIFDRTIDTGIAHGTVTVMLEKEGFEVTTYRVDGEYLDGRHPTSVTFTASLEEDLKRRDFTINAMAYHPDCGVVDLFEGQEDLKRGVIRCVGNAEERFTEDALRMMRALRFSAQLDFSIEQETAKAITKLAARLALVSKERIQTELVKLMTSAHPDRMLTLCELGLGPYVLSDFDLCDKPEQVLRLRTASMVPEQKHLRLAALFGTEWGSRTWDESMQLEQLTDQEEKKKIKDALRQLRFDNDTIDKAGVLLEYAPVMVKPDAGKIRRLISRMKAERVRELIWLQMARAKATQQLEVLSVLEKAEQMTDEIEASGVCVSLKQLAVNGKDLKEAQLADGKALGCMLSYLLELVLENPACNTKQRLLAAARQAKAEGLVAEGLVL